MTNFKKGGGKKESIDITYDEEEKTVHVSRSEFRKLRLKKRPKFGTKKKKTQTKKSENGGTL